MKTVENSFNAVRDISRSEFRRKVVRDQRKCIIFSTKFNPLGPNVSQILRDNLYLLQGSNVLKGMFTPGMIMVAHKRENNLKELLLRGDPYSIKPDIVNNDVQGYIVCNRVCDSCSNFVDQTNIVRSSATGRKYVIRKNITCTTNNVIYVAYCSKCNLQGVGSTTFWLPRLRNYKRHINKQKYTCNIVKHFLDVCKDSDNPCRYLRFILVDVVNNTENLSGWLPRLRNYKSHINKK